MERLQEAELKLLKSKRFLEEYQNKLIQRYPHVSNFSLGIVCLDMIISELIYFMSSDVPANSGGYHIIYFAIIALLLLVIIMKVNQHNLTLFKVTVISLFLIRLFTDFLEIYLFMPISTSQKQ